MPIQTSYRYFFSSTKLPFQLLFNSPHLFVPPPSFAVQVRPLMVLFLIRFQHCSLSHLFPPLCPPKTPAIKCHNNQFCSSRLVTWEQTYKYCEDARRIFHRCSLRYRQNDAHLAHWICKEDAQEEPLSTQLASRGTDPLTRAGTPQLKVHKLTHLFQTQSLTCLSAVQTERPISRHIKHQARVQITNIYLPCAYRQFVDPNRLQVWLVSISLQFQCTVKFT